jgi:glycosyltransferase involved in cell wall biosynthesis
MMNRRPLVSVIVPTFNHGQFIEQGLKSIATQSFRDLETVVLDNGSTDDTAIRARRCSDERFLLHSETTNSGLWHLHDTYNRALSRTHGDLIAVMEGDDYWPPQKLSRMVPAFEDPVVVMAYGRTQAVAPDGTALGSTLPPAAVLRRFSPSSLSNDPIGAATRAFANIDGQCFIGISSVMIRRSALEQLGGFQHADEFPGVDFPTFIELSLMGKFVFFDEVMAYWRRHPSSSSWQYRQVLRSGLEQYVRRFVFHNQARLAMNDLEVAHLLGGWRGRMDLAEGRSLLLDRRWEESRDWLTRAAKRGNFKVKLAASAGILASLLHKDLEFLVRRLGRDDQRVLAETLLERSPVGRGDS